jgi:outer membrane protein assembly factor BamE
VNPCSQIVLQMSVPFVFSSSQRVFQLTALAAACAALTTLTACGGLNSASTRVVGLITPYKVEVVQGNFVSKEQKEALQVGMPRAQVRDILGSPLVTSAFHADRWDYVFTIRRQGSEPQQRKLSVLFKGDELAKVESDELPSEEEFVGALSQGRRIGKVPKLELTEQELPKPPEKAPGTEPATAVPVGPATRSYPPLEPTAR